MTLLLSCKDVDSADPAHQSPDASLQQIILWPASGFDGAGGLRIQTKDSRGPVDTGPPNCERCLSITHYLVSYHAVTRNNNFNVQTSSLSVRNTLRNSTSLYRPLPTRNCQSKTSLASIACLETREPIGRPKFWRWPFSDRGHGIACWNNY